MGWHCFGVFDGIGGGEYGELASLYAGEICQLYLPTLKRCKKYEQIDQLGRNLFLEINNRIVNERKEQGVCGTTGTVLFTDGIMAKIFHIGDSRGYLYRKQQLYRMTKDQTTAQMKVDAGFYQSIQEASEREYHQLTEYIGRDYTQKHFRPSEGNWISSQEGDKILLCSDGLYDMCPYKKIQEIISSNMAGKEKISQLISVAKENGGIDNITCILSRLHIVI